MKRLSVLHCPEMVGGNPQGLARAERRLGLDSWAVAFSRSFMDYETDEVLCENGENALLCQIKRWGLLWRAVRHFDIVHFNFGRSIMPVWVPFQATQDNGHPPAVRWVYGLYARMFEQIDLPLLRKAGKGIVVTYQGDDARQRDYCIANFDITAATEVEPGPAAREMDARKRRRIERFSRYADRIFSLNPDLLHVLPAGAQFMPYAHVDMNEYPAADSRRQDTDTKVVLHAPTDRRVKGTRFVCEAVSKLRSEGVAVELMMIEGMSHEEATKLYPRADLLVDQLLVGWYGGLALETMALGKPVICYIREDDLRFIPGDMRRELPVINATPAAIYEVLREWLTVRANELPDVGRRSFEYARKWHDPSKIAARLQKEYVAIMEEKKGHRR